MHESVENVSMHAPQPERSIFMFLVETEEFLENRSQPSEQFEAGDGSPGGGGGAGGACGAARLFRTISSNSAMSFAILPCSLRSLLIRWRHSAASGSNSVENIRLLMSNNWSSQSFLAMGRALRVDVHTNRIIPTDFKGFSSSWLIAMSLRSRRTLSVLPPFPAHGPGGL